MAIKIKKHFFIIGNLAISLALLSVFVVAKYQQFQGYRAEMAQKRAELESWQKYQAEIDSLYAKLDKYKPELAMIDSSLPLAPSAPALFDFLQSAASQNNLVFKKIEFGRTAIMLEKPKVMKKEIGIIIESDYPAFGDFVSSIEKSSRMIQIESLSIALPAKGDVFTFNMTASAGFLPKAEEAVPASQDNYQEF